MGRISGRKAARRGAAGVTCIYCGVDPGTTDDHVPPECLFPPAQKPPKVPCCERCRVGQSTDDEYFKNTILMRHDVACEPMLESLVDSVHRALTRRNAQFARALARSIRWVELRSAAGLYVGTAATYLADERRLHAVVRRTVLGLYFKETGERLPDSCVAVARSLMAWQPMTDKQLAALETLVTVARTGTVPCIGDGGVFAYSVLHVPGMRWATLWLLMFYRRVVFVGFTGRREDFMAD